MSKLNEIICNEFEMEEEDISELSKFRKADLETVQNCMIAYADWYLKECLKLSDCNITLLKHLK